MLIVNHEGQGWWDPMSQAKGDVFSLAQRLDPGLNFGQVRKLLHGMVGMSPSYPAAERTREREEPAVPTTERWAGRGRLRRGSASWAYLAVTRALPPGSWRLLRGQAVMSASASILPSASNHP